MSSTPCIEVDDEPLAAPPDDPISTRAGFLPISLARAPIRALANISVYIRTTTAQQSEADKSVDPFTLFTAGSVLFDDASRRRLLGAGVKFVYIPISAHEKFRKQTESQIEDIVADPKMAAAAKWAVVYETSNELASELLSQRNLSANLPRLQNVSRAVSSLVLNDRSAFKHLFAASHHDFYTATHMVNVGTWMVALAYAMGRTDKAELCKICEAGVLHDIGKTLVSKEILNKTGQLTEDEWASLRSHPQLGSEYLRRAGVTDPMILAVAQQHHERLDGSGYPDKLQGDDIHPISRLCAVIDSFDAMTSLRPFKKRALPVGKAIDAILQESPLQYDAKVVAAWADLVGTADPAVTQHCTYAAAAPAMLEMTDGTDSNRRLASRAPFNCPVLVRIKEDGGRFEDAESIAATARNISAAGMGVLMPLQVIPGQLLKIHVQTKRRVGTANDLTGVCVRCRSYDDGWFEIGVKFRLGN